MLEKLRSLINLVFIGDSQQLICTVETNSKLLEQIRLEKQGLLEKNTNFQNQLDQAKGIVKYLIYRK